jgi:branched-chain amino acid transport system ATP-binding protein
MLELTQVDAFYGDLQALRGVSLTVGAGEIIALVGSNGAGKTTTLRTISGILRPRAGRIEFQGRRIEGRKPAEIVALGLAHVPEGRQLFPTMTVAENLEMGARTPAAKAARARTLARVFALFPRLRERRGQWAGTLSGGEQQMLAIGRGLMSAPALLMLDEPSLGLAPVLVAAIFDIIAEINRQGTAVLLVEQNVSRALGLCRRGYVLENGAIALVGTSRELLGNAHMRQAYLGL